MRARMRAHLGGDPGSIGRESLTSALDPSVRLAVADKPDVSIVTVTYGTGPIVIDCLAALAETLADVPSEVIVVDQPPPPGGDRALATAIRLRLLTAGVRLVECAANHGFGGANTVGVAHARAPIVVLLNPDAVVQPCWLAPLVAALGDPSVGIATPVLRNPDGTVQEAGQTLDDEAITRPITSAPTAELTDVTFASAACWAMRRADYEASGGFDSAYHPAYFEDVDLALRLQRVGLRTVVVAASEVVHHHGTSTRRRTVKALAQQAVFRARWLS